MTYEIIKIKKIFFDDFNLTIIIFYNYYHFRLEKECNSLKIKNKTFKISSMKSILDGVKYNKLSEYKNNKEIKMFIYYDNIYNKKSICLK